MSVNSSAPVNLHRFRWSGLGSAVVKSVQRLQLVAGQAENTRTLAEAEAHRVAAVMKALEPADPRVVQALAAVGMQPGQLIAQAFGGIAERAERIGSLNVSPELLQTLMGADGPRIYTPKA